MNIDIPNIPLISQILFFISESFYEMRKLLDEPIDEYILDYIYMKIHSDFQE